MGELAHVRGESAQCDNVVENMGRAPPLRQPLPRLPTPPGWRPSRPVFHPSRLFVQGEMTPEAGEQGDRTVPMEGATGSTGTSPPSTFDITQFSQWMVEHQSHLLWEIVHHQMESQASLVRYIQKLWTTPTPGGGSPQLPMGKPSWFPVTKLGPEDNIEVFLETYERTAEVAQWPTGQWIYLIGPYLMGPAQATVKALAKNDASEYKKLKSVIDRYEVTPETAREKFCSLAWAPTTQPQAMAAALRDAALRWLQPKTDYGRLVVDTVVLEQLLIVMSPQACHWVACSKPPDLKTAVALWENFMAAEAPEKKDGGCPFGTQGPRLGGGTYPTQGGGDHTG